MDPATITLSVQLATSPTRAFRALTLTAQLRRWFVDVLDYDRSLLVFGAGRQLTFIADTGMAGQGQVTAYLPPSLLEYTWDNETLRFELSAEGEETAVTFTNIIHGTGTDSTDTAAVTDAWQTALARLQSLFTDPTNPTNSAEGPS